MSVACGESLRQWQNIQLVWNWQEPSQEEVASYPLWDLFHHTSALFFPGAKEAADPVAYLFCALLCQVGSRDRGMSVPW